ncbi:MAG: hypothetical protein H6553_05915 [Chitinophagales bacterium]|nr:hypothetical protein [Chitinophagales bacterium]
MNFNQLFIVRLWKSSKLLSILIIVFCIFQLIFSLKRIQSFPWLTWDMYSRTQHIPQQITQREFYINDSLLNIVALSNWQEEVVKNSYSYYSAMKKNNFQPIFTEAFDSRTRFLNDKTKSCVYENLYNIKAEIKDYPNWLKRYLSSIKKEKIHTITVKERIFVLENNHYQPSNLTTTIDEF